MIIGANGDSLFKRLMLASCPDFGRRAKNLGPELSQLEKVAFPFLQRILMQSFACFWTCPSWNPGKRCSRHRLWFVPEAMGRADLAEDRRSKVVV